MIRRAALEKPGEVPRPGIGIGTLGGRKFDALDDLRSWTLNLGAPGNGHHERSQLSVFASACDHQALR